MPGRDRSSLFRNQRIAWRHHLPVPGQGNASFWYPARSLSTSMRSSAATSLRKPRTVDVGRRAERPATPTLSRQRCSSRRCGCRVRRVLVRRRAALPQWCRYQSRYGSRIVQCVQLRDSPVNPGMARRESVQGIARYASGGRRNRFRGPNEHRLRGDGAGEAAIRDVRVERRVRRVPIGRSRER